MKMKRIFTMLALLATIQMTTLATNELSISQISPEDSEGKVWVTVSALVESEDIINIEFLFGINDQPEGIEFLPDEAVWNTYWTTGQEQGTDFDLVNKKRTTGAKANKGYFFSMQTISGLKSYLTGNTWLVKFPVKITGTDKNIKITKINFGNTSAQNTTVDGNVDKLSAIDVTDPKFNATLATSGYTTVCAEYPLNFEGLDAYVVSSVKDGVAIFSSVTSVPANTGVVLKGTAGATVSIPFVDSATAPDANKLVGVTSNTDMSSVKNAYILSGGEFHPCSGGTLAANKAYLVLTDEEVAAIPASAKAISISFDDAETGISNITFNEDATNAPIYNLNGMRVQKAQKGIYIRNGKKYVVE